MKRKQKHSSARGITTLLLGLIVVGLGLVSAVLVKKHLSNKTESDDSVTETVIPPAPKPVSVSSKMMFMGTTFWGRYIHDWSQKSELKYAYPFSRLNEFNRDNYDAWIAGLECPTSPRINMTSAQMEANLQFNCRPEYLSEASKYFTIFGLANNHTDNQGELGFTETKQELEKHGIQYFGHYDPEKFDELCEIVAMPARVTLSDGSVKAAKLPVALCGYHGFIRNPSKESRAVVKKYAELFPTLALPHSGVEYKSAPDAIKTDLYRELIDNGADAVLGDHPHWVQTSEGYKGKLIVYSMGNFMFDQQRPPELTRSAAITLDLEVLDSSSADITAWTNLANSCQAFQDDCLEKAQAKKLKKLDYKWTFGVVGTDNANKIVKPATEEQINSILQRLRWSQTVSNLSAPYFGK